MTFRLRHLIAAVLLHGLLFTLLVGGLQCSRTPVRPPVIRAVLLDPDRKEQSARDRRAEERRAEERRKAAEKKRLEEERQKKLAAEAERKKIDEAKRKTELAEKKKIEEARKQELAEKKKAEEAARRKKEQQEARERQEQARREIQEQALREETMRQEARERELAREADARAASEREAQQAEWADALVRHVRKSWNPPPSAPLDFSCTVQVELLPDGTVSRARVQRSCGSGPLDRSVEEAVLRGSPLPLPRDMSIFDRELIINFRPR